MECVGDAIREVKSVGPAKSRRQTVRSAGVEGAYLRSSGDEVVARKGTGQVKVFARNRADAVVASNRRGQVLQNVRTHPTSKRRSTQVPPSTPGKSKARSQ